MCESSHTKWANRQKQKVCKGLPEVRQKWGMTAKGDKVSSAGDENVPKLDCGVHYTVLLYTKAH